ncbi:MAG: ABC transporter permease [Candidatus Eisenbacteria bacterium]|nr:ABC transporter permease [Candidatus Eisenbacteria bacterium]
MASPRLATEARLLRAALGRRSGTVALAVLAVAIGASVASALLHVSGDIGRKVTSELRTLGPNVLLVPAGADGAAADAGAAFLDESAVRARLAAAGVTGAPLLYMVAEVATDAGRAPRRMTAIGADLGAVRALHPGWTIESSAGADPATTLMGGRLMARLGVAPGARLALRRPGDSGPGVAVTVGARLTAGGADDEAWWIPLATAQAIAALPGRVSLAEARVDGGPQAAARAAARLERTPSPGAPPMRALVLHALSATEGRLLDRMRRLMALVTIAALVAAGLCAFGTLTDLALERRREIALMKALGATPGDIVRLFAAESLAIGGLGGLAGWLLGVGFAELIGRQVFHAAVALDPRVLLIVMALALAVAAVAGLGPIRLALAVEPAAALKGD